MGQTLNLDTWAVPFPSGPPYLELKEGATVFGYYYINNDEKNKNILSRGICMECNITTGTLTGYKIGVTLSGNNVTVTIGKYMVKLVKMEVSEHNLPIVPKATRITSLGKTRDTLVVFTDNYTKFTLEFSKLPNLTTASCDLLAAYGDKELDGIPGNQLQLRKGYPTIRIFCHSEVIYGMNLTSSVFRVSNSNSFSTYTRRPNIVPVIRGDGCTFSGKMYSWNIANGSTEDITEGVLRYVMLRYFLWFLISGKWCITLVKKRYTSRFMRALEHSEYAGWGAYFSHPTVVNYEKYIM